jgi:hypothetical protein
MFSLGRQPCQYVLILGFTSSIMQKIDCCILCAWLSLDVKLFAICLGMLDDPGIYSPLSGTIDRSHFKHPGLRKEKDFRHWLKQHVLLLTY